MFYPVNDFPYYIDPNISYVYYYNTYLLLITKRTKTRGNVVKKFVSNCDAMQGLICKVIKKFIVMTCV